MSTYDKYELRLQEILNNAKPQNSSTSQNKSKASDTNPTSKKTTTGYENRLTSILNEGAKKNNASSNAYAKNTNSWRTGLDAIPRKVKSPEQLAYEKDYEEKSKYDLDAAQREIDELEAQLKRLKNSSIPVTNPINGMPYAASQQSVFPEEYVTASTGLNSRPYAIGQQANYAPVDTQAAELNEEILRKKQYLNQAKQIQKKIAMESVYTNDDFHANSGYTANEDEQYNWINDKQFREQYGKYDSEVLNALSTQTNPNVGKSKYESKSYDKLSDFEIKLYNYYYATQGPEKAQEYLDTMQEELNKRTGEEIYNSFKDRTAAEIFYGAAAGFSQFDTGIRGAASMITGKDDYLPQSRQQFAGQYMREDLADNGPMLPEWMGGGSLAQSAYDLTSTTANMAPSILVSIANPLAGSALMGTSAAGNAYQTALNAGYDKAAARSYGVAIGVAETAMQSILGGISSMGGVSPAVTKAVEGIDNGLLRFFAQWGASMASEGLEEGLQEVLDPILQNALLGADENVDWANVVYSALLGAASAGVLEIGGNLKQAKQEANAKYEYGNKSGELVAEGLSYDTGTEANELAQQYKSRTDSGKELTGAQIKKLLDANEVQSVKKAANERLVELGETDDPSVIAELATKWALGEKLKPAERSRLARSKFGARVAHELKPGNVRKDKVAETMARPGKYKPLDSRVSEEVSSRVSESNKNELADSGKEFDLKQVDAKTDSNGKLVWTVDGQETTTDNMKFKDEDTAYVFEAVENIENITPTAAPVLVRSVDTSKDIIKQLNGLDEAYTYGNNGYTVEDMNAGEFVSELTDTQKMDAFRLGEAARKNRTDTRVESIKKMRTAAEAKAEKGNKPKLKITYDHGHGKVEDFQSKNIKGLTGKQRAAVKVAEMLHKLGIGTDFEFFSTYLSKTLKDPKTGKAARVFLDENGNEVAAYAGVYLGAGGKIRIDLNAYNGRRLALNAMSHELVHFVQDWSPEKYQAMAEFLANAYGETELSMHQRVLREQARLKKIRNQDVPYTEAYDEVVANALNKMFDDGTIMTKLAELRSQDAALADKIIEGIRIIADRLLKVFNQNQYLYHDTYDLMQMGDTFKQIQDMFAEALVDASDNLQAARIAQEAFGDGANIETNENGELLLAANENNSVVMYSEQTYLNGGRDKLETALRQNGHTEAEITETLSYVDDALDYIKVLAAGYAKQMGYTNLSNHLIADVITNVKTGKQVMSSIVNNGDYPVNIDLSLICKKRVAYMNLMSRLIRDGVFDKVNYDGAAIAEVNGILRENGFETACLGCFVESRRLQFQTWAETIVSEWNAEVEKRNPNADNFGFAKGDMQSLTDADINALTRELESAKKNDQGNVNLGQGNSITKMGRLLDALPSLQKKLTVEDLLTPEGLTALRQHDGSLFSIVKSRYGAASPKIVQDFNPYASEIAMLSFAQVKNITSNAVKGAQTYVKEVKSEYGKIVRANGESKENFNKRKKLHEQRIQDEAMRRYLYDIGGARIQSFSDFMIENVFDYIQIFADLAAKRLPIHGYTKEIVCMRLFGMTGAKWNGSLIAHVERSMGKELAGLLPAGTKDGIPVKVNGKDYVIGFDDYARNAATNGKSFIQSIGMKDILALQLDPRYSPYVGNITIGVSDAQITAMLDSNLFRMVIPYHASGMLPMFAKLVGVDMYNDYTDYQNTTVRQYYDLNGNAVSELKNAKGDAVKADTSYAFNAEIQKTNDAKTAANNYLKWCAQRHPVYDGKALVGYATFNPKFSSSPYGTDFTRHENYYKLLEDFNTYDSVTEESAVQGAVTMNFPSEENRLNEQQMAEYKNALRETGVFTEQDIEKYAKKADMTFKEIINAEVGNRANYAATQAPKWEATVKEVEAKLQKDYSRNQYSSQETDLDMSPIEQKLKDDAQADIDKAFAAAVDAEINNPTLSRKSLLIGYTPDILLKLGVPSLPMTFNNDHIYSCAKTKQEAIAEGFYNSRNNYHGLGASGVKKIYEALKDPVAVIVSKNPQTPSTPLRSTHSVVILVEIQGNKNSLLLPVKITVESRLGRLNVEVNEVSSAYDTDAAKYMRDAIWSENTEGVGVFYITEKAKTLVNGGLQLPTKLQQALASSGGIVHQIPEKINMAVSTNTQSVQFTNWFGDWQNPQISKKKVSVVVNADGTPKVVYHGTNAVFSEFAKGDIGYHVGSREQAEDRVKDEASSHVLSLYAVIRNPLYAAFDFGDWHGNYVASMLIETEQFEEHPARKSIEKRLSKIAEMGDVKESDDALRNYLEGLGYDGIIYENQFEGNRNEESYIVFRANQLKSANINVGSYNGKNNDFRYSTQETDNISNRHLLANAFEGISRNSVEYGMIQDYKRNIDKLNKLEEQLSDVNAEIRQLRFGKDVERDPERLRELEEKADGLAKEINKYDKRLINMEASEPLRKVLERERKKARQRTIEHTKQIQQNRKMRKEQTELRKRIRRTIMDLDKILNKGTKQRNVKDSLQAFVEQAIKATDVLFMDDVKPYDMIRSGFTTTLTEREKAQVEQARELLDEMDKIYGRSDAQNPYKDPAFIEAEARLDAKISEMSDIFERENMAREETTVSSVISKIMLEYKKLEGAPQIEVRNAYSDAVYDHMSQLASAIGNTRIKDMSTDQLQKLYEMYNWVKATVTMSNKFFADNIKQNVNEMATQSVNEFKAAEAKRKKSKFSEAVHATLAQLGWNNEKVMYALRRMDNSVISTLMQNIINGEDVTMRDVQDAIKFRKEIEKKHNYKKWDFKKTYTFEDKHGKKFEMTLQQMLSFYAYSRRDAARDHIGVGGVTVKTNSKLKMDSANAHAISEEGIAQIESALTEEQRAYVRDMQSYLSDVMGAKGNEVSLKLYGIKMFNEESYFPIRSSSEYLAKAGEANLKNEIGITNMASAGFTKSLTPHATTPIEIGDFIDTWANHVNEMSRYHGFVLPMEDFRRVFNFTSYANENDSTAVRASMKNAFGEAAVKYFDDLYRDLNSAASYDRTGEKTLIKLFSRFKKSAVMYSLSVVVQQPTAIVRAGAMIDRRYFGIFGSTGRIATGLVRLFSKNHTKLWNEMMEYAPGVTTIKEIGGFDTATGGSILSALKEETYEGIAENWNAFKQNPIKWVSRKADDNFLSRIPAYADQIAWVEIWNAVKRETVATHKDLTPNSKEFFDQCGKRFSEVIRMTQVYDSVFAKSPQMRSKNPVVQMLTSFMSEPNTTINMAEDGVREMMRGNKRSGARTLWTVAAAITFNNLIKSIVYAMRDDDEDQNFKEKYLEAVIGGMLNDINPLNYIPFARDVWSVGLGYDVERPDMTLISDLAENIAKVSKLSNKDTSEMDEEQLADHEKAQLAASMAMVDAISALVGFPIKNIRRDIKGFINTFFGDKVGESTKLSIEHTVEQALSEATPTMFRDETTSKTELLYNAIMDSDAVYVERLKSGYKDEKAYTNAVRKALRENDERIHEAAQALHKNNASEYKRIYQQIRSENKFSTDDILNAIDSEAAAIQKDIEGTSESSPYSASDFVKAVIVGDTAAAKTMQSEYISYKVSSGNTKEEAEKKFREAVQGSVNDAYMGNLLARSAAKQMLIKYVGKDEDEAEDRLVYWDFKKMYPEYNLSDNAVWDYYDIAEPLGISVRDYTNYVNEKKRLDTQRDENGKITLSLRDQIIELIDSLNLTVDQKDALYIIEGYTKNKLWNTPWH